MSDDPSKSPDDQRLPGGQAPVDDAQHSASEIPDAEWNQMIEGLRQGDPQVCTHFWNRYGNLLETVAQKQLSRKLQRRVGPDDIVQSACRTFFRRISDGQFDLPDADALWRLMCAITLTKARRAARDQQRQKRSIAQEQYIDAATESQGERQFQLASPSHSPLQAAEVADEMEALLTSLGEDECQVLDLKLQQFTNEEIAEQLQCSERTVRRLMKRIQERWNSMMDA